jgi:hypothetical protein
MKEESLMGFLSWLEAHRLGRGRELVRTKGPDDPQLAQLRADVEADVQTLEEDDKYFGRDAPSEGDLL